MSNKVGKATINRVEWGRWIASSVDVHQDRLTKKLDGKMGLDRSGWDAFLSGQSRELLAVTEELWDVSLELARERSDDPEHREERNKSVVDLLEKLGSTRSFLESVKPGLSQRFGLDGELPRAPSALEAFSCNVIENLRGANQVYNMFGVDFSTASMVEELEPCYQALRTKLLLLNSEKRKAEGLLILRDRALDDWERTYQVVAGMMEHIYRLVGEDELAKRVRSTIWRMNGKVGPDDADVEDKEDGSAKRIDGDSPLSNGTDNPQPGA